MLCLQKSTGSYPCETCGNIFTHKFSLSKHIKNVHSKQPCSLCGKMFPGYRLKSHIDAVHTEDHLKPFPCSICPKGFAEEKRLKNHMNIHTGNKPYLCKYCNRGFADDGNMKKHEKTAHKGFKRTGKGFKKVDSNNI